MLGNRDNLLMDELEKLLMAVAGVLAFAGLVLLFMIV